MSTPLLRRYRDFGSQAEPRAGVESRLNSALDEIFFGASNTTSFPDDAARRAFRERWLGRYLVAYPHLAHIAIAPNGRPLGYLVGAHDDPARTPLFDDIGYFRSFAQLTADFPAHLHVNCAPDARGAGLGSALIAAFLADARATGVPGAHVVTSRGARNVAFYKRNGFEQRGCSPTPTGEVVFLARRL